MLPQLDSEIRANQISFSFRSLRVLRKGKNISQKKA